MEVTRLSWRPEAGERRETRAQGGLTGARMGAGIAPEVSLCDNTRLPGPGSSHLHRDQGAGG